MFYQYQAVVRLGIKTFLEQVLCSYIGVQMASIFGLYSNGWTQKANHPFSTDVLIVLALDCTVEESDGSQEEQHSHPPPQDQENLMMMVVMMTIIMILTMMIKMLRKMTRINNTMVKQ